MIRITQRLVRARLIEWLDARPTLNGPGDDQDRSHMVLESIPGDQEFITEAFRRVLGRNPELDAIQHYSQILKSHPRSFVVDSLVEAAGAAAFSPTESALEFSPPLLNAASGSEPDYAPDMPVPLPAGSVLDLTALGLIDNPAQFVHDTYRNILGRTSDLAGFTHFRNLLRCGVQRRDVLALIAASSEARARNLRFTWDGNPLPPPAPLSLRTRLRLFVRGLLPLRQIDAVEHSLCLMGGQTRLIAAWQRHLSSEQRASAANVDRAFLELERGHLSAQTNQIQKVLDGLSAIDSGIRSNSPRLEDAELLIAAISRHTGKMDALGAKAQHYQDAICQKLDSISTKIELQQENLQGSLTRLQLGREDTHRKLDSIAAEIGARQADLQTAIDRCSVETGKERPQPIHKDIHRKLDAIAAEIGARQANLETALEGCRAELADARQLLFGQQDRIEQMIKPPVLAGADVLVAKVDDFVLAFPREDWVHAAHCAFWGTVEKGLTKHLRLVLRPGMVFVDIGANIGIHTLHAARVVGPAGRVHSFEPAPRTFNILKQNVVANSLECVDLYPIAILDRKARVPLYLNEGLSGLNSIFSGHASAKSIPVEAMTLDEALGDLGRIDIVKIDAEGAEPLILRGMTQIIGKHPRLIIFIEFAPQHLQRACISPADFLESLYSAGFDIERVDALTGELSAAQPGQLLSAYSENLRLQKR